MADKKKIYTAVAAIAVVVVLIATAFVFLGGSSASSNAIKANVNEDCAGTPWFVGMDIGYFDANGIEFIDKGHLDWGLQRTALVTGQTNVYDGHPNSVIDILKAGGKVKAVIAGGDEPEEENEMKLHMHWLARYNEPYDSYIDLIKGYKENGTKAKVALGGTGICADLENGALLRANGLSSVNGVDFVQVILPDSQMEAALLQGQVDVIIPHPPFYTAALQHSDEQSDTSKKVKTVATSSDAFGRNAGTTLVVFTEKFIKEHPDTVRAFIQAYKDSERWSNDHPDEAGELTADKIGLSSANTHWYSYTGEITDELIQPWIDAMVAQGIIKAGEYEPKDLYTTEFSDLWVAGDPQPLNPFNSTTNQQYGWYNETNPTSSNIIESNNYVAGLQEVAAGDVVNHYAAVPSSTHVHPVSGAKE